MSTKTRTRSDTAAPAGTAPAAVAPEGAATSTAALAAAPPNPEATASEGNTGSNGQLEGRPDGDASRPSDGGGSVASISVAPPPAPGQADRIGDEVAGVIAGIKAAIAAGDRDGALAHLAQQIEEAREMIDVATRVYLELGRFQADLRGGEYPPVRAPAPADAPELDAEPPRVRVRVRVTGPKSGRRRLGRHFGEDAVYFDATADEIAQLKADASLMVVVA